MFFGGQFFGGGFYGSTPIPVQPIEQASNWQAHYWLNTKRRTKQDDDDERRALGILPPELESEAEAVVTGAVNAATIDDSGARMFVAMEARQEYEDIYRKAYAAAYVETIIHDRWMADVARVKRRRAIEFLLLH